MAEEKKRKRKKKPARQAWKPNWAVSFLHKLWMVLFAAFKIAVGAAVTVLLIGIVCGFVLAGILGDYLENDIAPDAEFVLENYGLDLTSSMYYVDSNGDIQVLQQIYATTARKLATYDEIPEDLIHAAVAIEDKRFYEHQGVDWITTIKACIKIFTSGSSDTGGSTITQQLVKNVTHEDSVTVQRKVLEIFRATVCEQNYSKEVIMEEYLNRIYLGQGCYGVKSAASVYFGKELQMLTTAECASLISITNNPSLFDPYGKEFEYEGQMMTGAERNRTRQLKVLYAMYVQGWITKDEYDEAVDQEMVFKNGIADEDRLLTCPNEDYTGIANTFVQQDDKYYCPVCGEETSAITDASQSVYSWFVDTVLEDVAKALAEQDGVEWNKFTKNEYLELIRRSGYSIYTTLDMDVQNAVDKIYTNLDEIPATRSGQQLQSGMVVIDNRTGDIVAMSGGVGEKDVFDAYNRATDAPLQTGSSIKPLTIYAPAFELGIITPATVIKDLPLYYTESSAFPLNDTRTYSYSRTILSGVTSSVNAVAVNTLDMIGLGYSFNFAKDKFGLSGLTDSYVSASGMVKTDIDYAPLGMGALTLGVSVRDMASAFATFANDGVYREGRTFTKVYDSEGNLVLDNTQETRQILSSKTVEYMNYCLQNAVSSGTGTVAKFSGMDIAGKTGTTSSNKDRWFCGFTGYYTAAVWCGYDQPEVIQLVGDTTNPAARLWKKVMQPIHEGLENIPLYDSSNFTNVQVCLDSGLAATDACALDIRTALNGMASRVTTAGVYEEDIPTETCDKHVLVDYCTVGGAVANEYCELFAEAGEITLKQYALVKMTQDEIDALLAAKDYRLDSNYLMDNYVYLVDSSGNPLSFKGFSGNANQGVDAPYIVCTVHTKEAWETYQAHHATKPTEPEPTEPEPSDPWFTWPWN